MNAQPSFKYDVAISFLQEDEILARELNNLLSERLKTFIYFDRQKELAGTNGEETFNRVFGNEARIVLILYRENWGNTPWTRIEETAIRNRAYADGYDFALMIPLHTPPSVPKWFPMNRIWLGFDRWGLNGAIPVIESRVQEADGVLREETALEHASRLNRMRTDEELKVTLLGGKEGVRKATAAANHLFEKIELLADSINEEDGIIKLVYERTAKNVYQLQLQRHFVYISWFNQYANSLADSMLVIDLHWRGKGSSVADVLETEEFDFDVRLPDLYGWSRRSDNRFLTSDQLAEHCVKMILTYLQTHPNGDHNKPPPGMHRF